MSETPDLSAQLKPLPWQHALWLDLTALVLQQQLPHALLLQGPAGVGKRWFARALSAFLLCEDRSGYACGKCRSCTQIAVGAHPNAMLLGHNGLLGLAPTLSGEHPQGLVHWQPAAERKRKDISIEAARVLIEKLTMATHYGQARVCLIDPADGLNNNSVNALLKTIEEPPPGTHLMLVSERPQALTATLRSRCQRVRFLRPEADQAQEWLSARLGHPDEDALAAAHGAPLSALLLAEGDGLSQRHDWREMWISVAKRRQDPVTAAASVDRDSIAEHLNWAWSWIAEHFREGVLAGADSQRREALDNMMNDLIDARRRVSRGNVQPQMLLESLLVSWVRSGQLALGVA